MRVLALAVFVCAFGASAAHAAGKPGKAAAKKEAKPAKVKMRGRFVADKAVITSFSQAVEDHIVLMQEEKGAFLVFDEKLQKHWSLALDSIHKDRIRKLSENSFLACADFDETDGTQKVEVDFYVTRLEGTFTVDKTVVHKVDGSARFGYNDKNEQISNREAAKPPKAAKKPKAAPRRKAAKKLAPVKFGGDGDAGPGDAGAPSAADAQAAAAAAAAAGYQIPGN